MAIITPLFAIASPTGDEYVSWDVQAGAVSIHAIEMLYNGDAFCQIQRAVGAAILEPKADGFSVLITVYTQPPFAADLPAQFMKEHADQLICYIGLRSSCGRA